MERLAFLYDSTRFQPSGLVGEIVLPPIGDHPQRQFARSPYTASFTQAGVELAQWMHDWAVWPGDWNSNLIVLGEFNLDRIGDPLYEAFIARVCGHRRS
ncbi:hypothetical protein [Arthrobacter sp. SO3]|uniref:hypothetical protein n=1 Tax=Arthrobacter sp. SO3 TaxID=1897057 RepID=UPI001CFF6365|nr:hypothetical protein [Arthrobacter sp. SO3]MCB5291780.1 hypothetical protein [Arthrobacter sp. SO3]